MKRGLFLSFALLSLFAATALCKKHAVTSKRSNSTAKIAPRNVTTPQPKPGNVTVNSAAIVNSTTTTVLTASPKSSLVGSTPVPSGMVEIRIGLLLPYGQTEDQGTTDLTISGTSAIRLAFQEINQEQKLLNGAWINVIQQDSFAPPMQSRSTSSGAQAIYATMALEQQGVAAVIGDVTSRQTVFSALITSKLQIPQCSYSAGSSELSNKADFATFFRTIPSNIAFANVMIDIIKDMGWVRYGVLYSADTLGQQMATAAANRGRGLGLQLIQSQQYYEAGPASDFNGPLQNMKDANVRIIVLGAVGPEQIQMLTTAVEMKMTGEYGYVWIVVNNVIEDLRPNFPDNMDNVWEGLLMVDNLLELSGELEYERFLDKWQILDPVQFPMAGQRNITSNEGLAYSCAMVLARGFSQAIQNTTDPRQSLLELGAGNFSANFTLDTWNTGYVGPGGPMNFDEVGDVKNGNFRVLNFHSGSADQVGTSKDAVMNFSKPVVFFKGSLQPPSDSPPSIIMNLQWNQVPSIVILFIATFMMVLCVTVGVIIISHRKVKMFKAASPTFCLIELLGLFCAYTWMLLQIGEPSYSMCWISPMMILTAYVLVLGAIVVKNQRIYTIFDNVFAATSARIVIKDWQLARVCGSLLLFSLTIITIMLSIDIPTPTFVKVTDTQHFITCSASSNKPGTAFTALLIIFNFGLLAYATFLSYRTRNVAGTFSECKQIALSVYNILVCAIIASPSQFLPSNEFYAGFYLKILAVWVAATFTLVVLFGPKLWQFFILRASNRLYDETFAGNHNSGVAGSSTGQFWLGCNNGKFNFDSGNPANQAHQRSSSAGRLLDFGFGIGLTSNGALSATATSPTTNERFNTLGSRISQASSSDMMKDLTTLYYGELSPTSPGAKREKQVNLQAFEGVLPMKKVYRGLTFLSIFASWEMKKVIVIPSTRYFTCIGMNNLAKTYGYVGAQAMLPRSLNEDSRFELKVTGPGWTDYLFQVQSHTVLDQWCRWFTGYDPYPSSSSSFALSTIGKPFDKKFQLSRETNVTYQTKPNEVAGNYAYGGGANGINGGPDKSGSSAADLVPGTPATLITPGSPEDNYFEVPLISKLACNGRIWVSSSVAHPEQHTYNSWHLKLSHSIVNLFI